MYGIETMEIGKTISEIRKVLKIEKDSRLRIFTLKSLSFSCTGWSEYSSHLKGFFNFLCCNLKAENVRFLNF